MSKRLLCYFDRVLVADWRRAWKWYSVWVAAAIGAGPVLVETLPALKEYLPAIPYKWLMLGATVLWIMSRLKNQTPPPNPPGSPPAAPERTL